MKPEGPEEPCERCGTLLQLWSFGTDVPQLIWQEVVHGFDGTYTVPNEGVQVRSVTLLRDHTPERCAQRRQGRPNLSTAPSNKVRPCEAP